MADDAANKAQQDLIKTLVKEAITEWQAEETTRRTEAEPPKRKDSGLFGTLFGA